MLLTLLWLEKYSENSFKFKDSSHLTFLGWARMCWANMESRNNSRTKRIHQMSLWFHKMAMIGLLGLKSFQQPSRH